MNGSVAPTLSDKHQVVPRLVTPVTLLDASSITQELNEFRLQQQATQQITQALNESRDIEFEHNRLIREDREAPEAEQQRQAELAQFQLF